MSKSDRQSGQRESGDTPLQLADSTHGSELRHLIDESTDTGDGSSLVSASSSGSASSLADDSRGKSTGFETMLGKVFIDRGYVTPEELEACRAVQKRSGESGRPRELADVLVESEYITRRQLDRVRSEIEAEKSTQQIPGFKITSKLGHGAMATVFLARQISLDRLVAIKVLPKKFSNNEKFIERFYKEGRAAAQLNHRNIVAAYDVGQAGEHHYFVMEYVEGETVYDRLLRNKRFGEGEAIDVVRQVAEALVHAHGRGFIHRDIKPKNIMLGKDGVVKLADLGLARAVTDKEAAEAEAGRAYGTPYYISPEQIRGEVVIGPKADIYCLGATFYHMVTGKVPFDGRNPSSVMHKHLKQKLTPPDHVYPRVSAGTAQVIEMMMAKSRRSRYGRVEDLIVDLEHITQGEPPHFARAQHDLTGIATAVEEKSETGPIAIHKPKRAGGRRLDDPMFLGVGVVAAISLLLNLVLIIVLTSGDGDGRTTAPFDPHAVSGTTEPNGGSNGTLPPRDPLTGTWGSTQIQGRQYAGTKAISLILGSNGQASWIEVTSDDKRYTFDFPYRRTDDRITLLLRDGEFPYTYILEGETLILKNSGDVRITFRRVR